MLQLESKCYDNDDDEEEDSTTSSGEEIPIWVKGDQRWVSGIGTTTTCEDIVRVLLQDEQIRGRNIGSTAQYQITERWRGVEQILTNSATILDIWNAWGSTQSEVKFSLKKAKWDRPPSNRRHHKSTTTNNSSDKNSFKTIHPKRLLEYSSSNSTDELLKLVLAQGEVIRKQLKKLRHSEHQIGFLEEKTHKERVRKHGSNYLLETYLRSLSEAINPPDKEETGLLTDKNSDSGVVTDRDSEQSNKKPKTYSKPLASSTQIEEEPPPPPEPLGIVPEAEKQSKNQDELEIADSELQLREQVVLLESLAHLNKKLLREEEHLVRLEGNLKKYQKYKTDLDGVLETLNGLRAEMAKGTCELQHNEMVLEEIDEKLDKRKLYLDTLRKDLQNEEHDFFVLQQMVTTAPNPVLIHHNSDKMQTCDYGTQYPAPTKELLDTLV